MSENAFVVPLDEADGHLSDVIAAATQRHTIAYLTDQGRRVAAIVPADEAWYWTPGWQSAEADADIREGRTRSFENMDDLFAEIDALRGEDLRWDSSARLPFSEMRPGCLRSTTRCSGTPSTSTFSRHWSGEHTRAAFPGLCDCVSTSSPAPGFTR
ncbi:type II toxin-antitoxin system Phd/YefM family antitoxin [Microbispora sp. H10830]|uniref:type II toxin-antitoxin system Phd/YefM family antitoxin n=1 Tax=Microbispora sp. H10830 TaxID=2729109 RepID=UPI001602EAB5|nr:type II toxin-antitoxin system Phd/YefM family antitoxin [Microbispora sp. H10830]